MHPSKSGVGGVSYQWYHYEMGIRHLRTGVDKGTAVMDIAALEYTSAHELYLHMFDPQRHTLAKTICKLYERGILKWQIYTQR
ncbi:MAG: hypothetical protein ACLSH1_00435 [Clostridia bacterium]